MLSVLSKCSPFRKFVKASSNVEVIGEVFTLDEDHRKRPHQRLLDDTPVVKYVELLCVVSAGEMHGRMHIDQMGFQEVDHVVDLLPDDAPEIVDRFIARDRPMLLEFFFMCVE